MNKVLGYASTALYLISFPQIVLAAENIDIRSLQSQGIRADTTLAGLTKNVFTLVFSVASLAVIVMLVWGAWQWITSGGDKEKIAAAQKRIMNALIGLAVLAVAFLIARIVGSFLGFDLLSTFNLPNLGPSATPGACPNGLTRDPNGTCP